MAATEATAGPPKGAVRAAIAAACGLLGVGGSGAEATEVQSAVLGYSEQDRVQAFEAVVDVNHEFSGGLNFFIERNPMIMPIWRLVYSGTPLNTRKIWDI